MLSPSAFIPSINGKKRLFHFSELLLDHLPMTSAHLMIIAILDL